MTFLPIRHPLSAAVGATFLGLTLAAATGPAHAQKAAANKGSATFTVDLTAFDMPHMRRYGLMYFPKVVKLTTDKPTGIHKEPHYKGTPKYATIHLGNGPHATFLIAIDEPDAGDSHLYVDVNHDGDLTNDGDGSWGRTSEENGTHSYYKDAVFQVSYGTAKRETSHAQYALELFHRGGQDVLIYWRQSARSGLVTINGKKHKALLVENDSDGIYSKPVNAEGQPIHGGSKTLPVWLLVDLDDVGLIGSGSQRYDIRTPFVIRGTNYEAIVSADGARVKLQPTTRAVVNPDQQAAPPAPSVVLANGKVAPDFTVQALDGHTLKLSDYKGKIVVLDFWATWCGPCNASMPHLQRVYEAVKDKDVVVLGVCVADEKQAFQQWVSERSKKFTFQLAFDPAGRNQATSISKNLYGVDGIPTTFVIDRDGKVAASVIGFEGDTDKRIEDALSKLNVQVVESSASAR